MGLFIILSAVSVSLTTIAVLFNEAAESSRREQEAERRAQDERRDAIKAARQRSEAAGAEAARRYASEQQQANLRLIENYEADLPQVREDLDTLVAYVESELGADTTSLWRKQALRREYRRLTDAQARVNGYADYLREMHAKSLELFDSGRHEELVDLSFPEATLPDDWLYVGKLVFLTAEEMDRPHARFKQKLHWEYPADRQRAIMLSASEKTPVLVASRSKKNPYVFYACAARGRIEHSHIKAGEPLVMHVERALPHLALCEAFNGLFRAALPRHLMQEPALKPLPGQRVDVHVSSADLLLTCNPFQGRTDNGHLPRVEVSELPVQPTGQVDRRLLFVEAGDSELEALESTSLEQAGDRPFDIIDYDAAGGRISLCSGSVRLDCRLDRGRGVLKLEDASDDEMPLVGSASGFDFKIVPEGLGVAEELGWPAAIQELEQRGRLVALSPELEARRHAHARLFRRWQQVINFQMDRERRAVATFECRVTAGDEAVNMLEIPSAALSAVPGVSGISPEALIKRIGEDPDKMIARCCRLEYWNSEQGAYLPAMSRAASRRSRWLSTERGLTIHARFRKALLDGAAHALRLVITELFAPLDRQHRALRQFVSGDLVNPLIKEVILDPGSTSALSRGVAPDDPDPITFFGSLNESQQAAVRMALRREPLCLIQGPPGTGKTSVIVEIVKQVLASEAEARILIVSQQHVAIDNALERLISAPNNGGRTQDEVLRIGDPRGVSESIQPWCQREVSGDFLDQLIRHADKIGREGDAETRLFANAWRSQLQAESASLDKYGRIDKEMFSGLLGQRRVVGATCVGVANRSGTDAGEFDYVIIDEAGKSTVPELLIPLMKAKKAILIGDHHQLPPSIARILREDDAIEDLPFLCEAFFETSFFESLFRDLPPRCKVMLDVQYRMPPALGTLVSDLFYSEAGARRLQNGPATATGRGFGSPLLWIDVQGRQSYAEGSTSPVNDHEAEAIAKYLVGKAHEADGSDHLSVVVITPYAAQRDRIRRALQLPTGGSQSTEALRCGRLSIRVNTVDAFQGSEADLVCYSPVRTRGNLEFVHDRRRLNVACSRARRQMMFFGDREFLANWKPHKEGELNLFAEIIARAGICSGPTETAPAGGGSHCQMDSVETR